MTRRTPATLTGRILDTVDGARVIDAVPGSTLTITRLDIPWGHAAHARTLLTAAHPTITDETRHRITVTAGRENITLETTSTDQDTAALLAIAVHALDTELATTGRVRIQADGEDVLAGPRLSACNLPNQWRSGIADVILTRMRPHLTGTRFGQAPATTPMLDTLARLLADIVAIDGETSAMVLAYRTANSLADQPHIVDVARALHHEPTTPAAPTAAPAAASAATDRTIRPPRPADTHAPQRS